MKKNKKRTKIIIFLSSFSGGGAERTVLNIIRKIDKEKFEVVLLTMKKDIKSFDYSNFIPENISIIQTKAKRLRYALFDIVKVIKKEKPDILFTTLAPANKLLVLAEKISREKIPVIIREANTRSKVRKLSLFEKLTTKFFYNKASKVISLSEGVKEDMVINFGVKRDRIKVIYNPIDIGQIDQLKNKVVYEIKKNLKTKYIVALGRLVEQKDYPTLIDAFEVVSEKFDVKLIILGKGKLEKELKELVKRKGLEDSVIFLGFQANPYKFLNMADVFVLSSKWEGFGHVIAEAMAVGVPVVSTNCKSGPSEILKNGKYGELVDVGNHKAMADKILKVLNMSKEDLKKRVTEAKRRVKDFEASKIVNQYEKLFEMTINNSKSR